MPRPKAKPRHGLESEPFVPVTLAPGAQRLLCNHAMLRLADAGPMLSDVAEALGLWPGLEEAIEGAPTSKECAAALRPVAEIANALRGALTALDTRSRARLAARVRLEVFERQLFRVWVHAAESARELGARTERGQRPRLALGFVVEQLARVFERYSRGEEANRTAFVSVALEAGGIDPGEFDVHDYLLSLDRPVSS